MAILVSFFVSVMLGLTISCFCFSVVSCRDISTESFVETSCPLNIDVLRRLVNQSPSRPVFIDVGTHCESVVQGIRLIRSDYLRRTGYFLPAPTSSEACWESYRSLYSEFEADFDLNTACGHHPEYISAGCMNITTASEFETQVPESILREIGIHCNQSLENSSVCKSCTDKLLSLEKFWVQGRQASSKANESECSGYPFMYVAAVVNKYGPTYTATAKCMFSLDFSSNPSSSIKKHQVVIAAAVLGSVVGMLGAITAVCFVWARQMKREEETKRSVPKKEDGTSLVLGFGLYQKNTNLVNFKFDEIKSATSEFSRDNIVGKGGYGNVYKGTLPDGSRIAVKRFKNCSSASSATFVHELEIISSVRHVNLVALRGYSTTAIPFGRYEKILVCDLIHNGSLSTHLFDSNHKLTWPTRHKIAIGTARGVSYLHHGVYPAIIHRDIKSSNILLDESFEPKVADFGLAKYNATGKTHLSTRVAGTLGYVSPEYALYGKLSERSDVYSFGVVFLELLSGKKAYEERDGKIWLLTDWAWGLVQQGKALDVVEEDMVDKGKAEEMEQYVVLASLCAHPTSYARPTMEQIVKIMETHLPIHSVAKMLENQKK